MYSSKFAAMIVPRMLSLVLDVAEDNKRSLSNRNASAKDLKINAISRVPPELSLSGLFGSSIETMRQNMNRRTVIPYPNNIGV